MPSGLSRCAAIRRKWSGKHIGWLERVKCNI
jgi:hypothetical protein